VQYIYWTINSNDYSKCNLYIIIIYNGIIYKDSETIITNNKTIKNMQSQILTAREKIILRLFKRINNNISIPIIKKSKF
jgi:hypothetical protein